jgi:small-conductance mechanosensitive channel
VSDQSINEADLRINELNASAAEKSQETETMIRYGAIFSELEQSFRDWRDLSEEVGKLSGVLIKEQTTLDNELRALQYDESRWSATETEIKNQEFQPEIAELTNKAITDLAQAVKLVEDRRERVVALQRTIAKQDDIATTQVENLKKAMEASQRSLLEPDSPPLWKVQMGSQPEDSFASLLRRSYPSEFRKIKAFANSRRTAFTFIGLLVIVAFVFFDRLRRLQKSKSYDSNVAKPDEIFGRPLSLAILVGNVVIMPLLPDGPKGARGLVYLIGMVPMIRLLMPRLKHPLRQMLVASIVSVFAWQLIIMPPLPLWLKRDLLAVFVLLLVVWLAWLLHSARTAHAPLVVTVGVYIATLLLIISLLANLFGYVGLAHLLTDGTLVSAYRAVVLYTIVVIGALLISAALRANVAQHLTIVRTSADLIIQRLSNAIVVIALLAWVHQTLNLFALRRDLYDAIGRLLNHQTKFGTVTFAPINIVAFLLTLILGYLVAAALRAILGQEILPRLRLGRGLPNAIATITHYILLVMIFVLALAGSGVELSKFTILTGALGVGLGFGLQNVVNNFVSGLVLLFERPVRVGDLLEIGLVSGEVTKIGVRSSTLHTFDGSDLIVPNADLISQQVVNWTFSGTRRQIILPIPVAYGNDPGKVRDLLRNVTASHPEVMKNPAPLSLFLGFGDSALNFEIRFWAPHPQVVLALKSEVALSIAAALNEAGIKVPVPQRNLHITTSDERAQAIVGAPDGEEKEARASGDTPSVQ